MIKHTPIRPVGTSRRQLLVGGGVSIAATALPFAPAFAVEKVVLRTNWLFYGSHSIFFLGVDKGFYGKHGLDVIVKQGNGSGNTVRLVANKDSTFAYVSCAALIKLAVQDAPIISVATIDAMGTEAVLVRPDAGIKSFKQLEGKKVLTTAGAGVNTFFPIAAKNAGVDVGKIELVNVAESALVSSYLQNMAPAMLGGIDDKPAEIKANGGQQPVIFAYSDYGVDQPGYCIATHKDLVKSNPEIVRGFVQGTIEAVKAAKANPDEAIASLINWKANTADDKEKAQAREVLNVTLSVLTSKNNKTGEIGMNVKEDWESALNLLKEYSDLKTDKTVDQFFTNEFLPKT
jgi:NitT/TauT family transport system substrate-binding protein